MPKKRTHIFYNYNGQDITFAFEEGFNGRIQDSEPSGLLCSVINTEEDATVVYITEVGGKELLRLILPK
jgi:hypothetical protein